MCASMKKRAIDRMRDETYPRARDDDGRERRTRARERRRERGRVVSSVRWRERWRERWCERMRGSRARWMGRAMGGDEARASGRRR